MMLPYPEIPYAQAPAWCFPVFELSLYILFLWCLAYAVKQGRQQVCYLLGGLLFGLVLEYMEVLMGSYTYGHFGIMLGKAPMDIPLCIGIGWAIIMYSSRLFSDRLGLALWAAAALDTLLALNIDLSMDTVAYRTHMWHWYWSGAGLNPLTAQWFGIPYGNFVGWQTVVFCYSAFSRIFEKQIGRPNLAILKSIFIAVLSLICSIAVLYGTEEFLFPVFNKINILPLHRFIGFTVLLLIVAGWGWRKKKATAEKMPAAAWLVPAWSHLFFFACFFILGFYMENKWMTLAACINLVIAIAVHILPVVTKKLTRGGQYKALNETLEEVQWGYVPAKEKILVLERLLTNAIKDSDLVVLDQLLHDELIFTNHVGRVMGKAADMEAHRSGELQILEIITIEQQIQLIEDVAIVAVKKWIVGNYTGKGFEGTYQYTRVWKKVHNKGWQVIAASCVGI